jgi:hypothetical protein
MLDEFLVKCEMYMLFLLLCDRSSLRGGSQSIGCLDSKERNGCGLGHWEMSYSSSRADLGTMYDR